MACSSHARIHGIMRGALESGEADRLGLDRGFITAMPAAGRIVQRSRPPFPDGVARALAGEASLQALARDHDPLDRGLRDARTIRRAGAIMFAGWAWRLAWAGRAGRLVLLAGGGRRRRGCWTVGWVGGR
jgi:hypothetical protein